MGRFIQKALAGAGKGIAAVGTEQLKADILAKRDAKLQEYANSNADTTESFQTSEREKAQEFKSEENKLNRESAENLASLRSTGSSGNYKVVNGQLINLDTKSPIDIPASQSERNKLAAQLAQTEFRGNSTNMELDEKPTLSSLIEVWGDKVDAMYKQESKQASAVDPDSIDPSGAIDLSKMSIDQLMELRKKTAGN